VSLELETQRLRLVAVTAEMARAATRALEQLVGATLPREWADGDVHDVLPAYARRLAADPTELGYGPWLVIERSRGVVVGSAGFMGRPDADGTVTLGYETFAPFRCRGYGFEAAHALVEWALAQPGVRLVQAECDRANVPSIRILEKLGMRRAGERDGALQWTRP
jgi:ribosomal-protein-alanine N-acetyltransferase